MKPYLSLDAVEAAAPEDLAPLQFHLSVVDLIEVLHLLQLLLGDLVPLRAVTRRLQELQPTRGDAGHQLRGGQTQTDSVCRDLTFAGSAWATLSQ